MRSTTLTLIATALFVLPAAAQNPPRPAAAPRRPVPAAVRGDTGAFTPLTEAQHDRLDAIRSRYAKERRAEREASRARREKMREEMRAVLTPAQRARMEQRRDAMGERMRGIRARMAAPRGIRGFRPGRGADVPMGPPMRRGRMGMAPMPGLRGTPGALRMRSDRPGPPPAAPARPDNPDDR